MIIQLNTNGTAVMTNFNEEKERFDMKTVRMAYKNEYLDALNSIPASEISAHPQGFRNLALAIAGGEVYIGRLLSI